MAITAAQVKQLRDVTGAGMMDCKKALTETNGDMDAAVEFLRKKGQAKAEKKASRIAAEGICFIAQDGDTLYIVDQHAAHERILYDRFSALADDIPSQQLLVHLFLDFQLVTARKILLFFFHADPF